MKIDRKKFSASVYKLVNKIPRGKVMTYGQIAAILGFPRCAQYVGWCLHWSDFEKVPYQRVLNRFGGLASGYTKGGREAHRIDLLEEGIKVKKEGTVDLKKYLWWPKETDMELMEGFKSKIKKLEK